MGRINNKKLSLNDSSSYTNKYDKGTPIKYAIPVGYIVKIFPMIKQFLFLYLAKQLVK